MTPFRQTILLAKRVGFWAILSVTCLFLIHVSVHRLDRSSLEQTRNSHQLYRTSPEVSRLAALSYRTAVASALWVDLIFAYANAAFLGASLDDVPLMADLVVALDPKWRYPYEFVGLVCDGKNGTRAEDGLRLLDKGIEVYPTEWRFRLYKAMILRGNGAEVDEVSATLLPLSRQKDVPEYVRTLAFTLLAKEGKPQESMGLLLQTLENVRDPVLSFQFQGKIADLLRVAQVPLGKDSADFLAAMGSMLYGDSQRRAEARRVLVGLADPATRGRYLSAVAPIADEYRTYLRARVGRFEGR